MRISELKARLRRLEVLCNPRLLMVCVDGSEMVFVTFEQLMKGCQDLSAGVASHDAYIASHGESKDEWAGKCLEMLHAILPNNT